MNRKLLFMVPAIFAVSSLFSQSVDTGFGDKILTAIGGANYDATLPDGKFMLSSSFDDGTVSQAVIAKVNQDGTIDTSFGTNGKIILDQFSDYDYYESFGLVKRLSNGKFLAGYGYEYDNGIDGETWGAKLMRFNPDGSVDNSFSSAMNVNPNSIYGYDFLPSGKILAFGENFLRRYNENGSLDTTYGNGGTRTIAFEPWEMKVIDGAVFLQDGFGNRLVKLANEESLSTTVYSYPPQSSPDLEVSGNFIYMWYSQDQKLVKLDTNFTPVSSFGNAGTLTLPQTVNYYNYLVQPQGSIIFWSTSYDGNNNAIRSFGRYTPKGLLDTTFGNNGNFQYVFNHPDFDYSSSYEEVYHNPVNDKLYVLTSNYTTNNTLLQRINLPAEFLAVTSVSTQSSVKILENPVKDLLKLSENLTNAEIYDASGARTGLKLNGTSTSVQRLTPGLYIITGKDKAGISQSLKFIKK